MSFSQSTSPGLLPIPGYRPLPFFGGRLDALRFFSDPIGHLVRLEREFGPVASFAAGSSSFVCVFGAENNRVVLSDPATFNHYLALPFRIPRNSPASRIFDNILAMNGERHKRYRRVLMPVVNKTAVSAHAPAVVRMTRDFLRRWKADKPLPIVLEMGELIMRVSTHCLFGVEPTTQTTPIGPLSLRLLGLLSSPWTIVFPVNLRGTHYAGFLETTERIEAVLRKLIQEKQNAAGADVLSCLIEFRDDDGSKLDDHEIIALSTSMLFGGQDALTNTLTWALVLLSQHAGVLDRLQAEIDDVLRGEEPTESVLPQMPWLDSVVQETMRILPPIVHSMFRRATSTTRIGRHEIKEGSVIVVSPFNMHRNPDLYPNPQRFDPERWSRLTPGPYEYMPFGAGPRMCIGVGFSAMVVRFQLAMILQRFRPVLPENTRIDYLVRAANLGAKEAIPLYLVDRRQTMRSSAPVQGSIRQLVDFPGGF